MTRYVNKYNYYSSMKIAFVTTIYRDEELVHIERLKKEVLRLAQDKSVGQTQDIEFVMYDARNDNRGYAYGINRAIEKAKKGKPDLYVIINPDVSIPNKIDFTTPAKQFDVWGGAMKQQGKIYYGGTLDKWRLSSILIETKPKSRFTPVDFVSGALMIVKKEVIEKVGLWDESYFLYYDEVDYCKRAVNAGFKLGVDTELSYDHFERSDFINPKKKWYLVKSRLKFFLKYSNTKQKIREIIRLPKTLYEETPTIVNHIKTSPFMSNFLSLNASSFVGKVLNFILFLLMVRYLTPEAYGMYVLVWTQINILVPFIDLGTTTYGLIHGSAEKKDELTSVFSLRLASSVLIFFATLILAFFNGLSGHVGLYLLLLSVVIFSNMASGSLLIATSIAKKSYISSLVSTVFNLVLTGVLALILVTTQNLLYIFICIFILYFSYTFVNVAFIIRTTGTFPFHYDPQSWIRIMRKSYIFVLISFFAGLYFRIDVLLLEHFKTSTAVGIYSAGYKFFEALIFIAVSYNFVAAPLLSNVFKKNQPLFPKLMKRDVLFLCAIGTSIAVGMFIFAPIVLPLFLKGNYSQSIHVLQVVIFALPLVLMSTVFVNGLYIIDRAYTVIFVFAFQAVVNFALNFLFIPRFSYMAASFNTLICEVINLLLLMMLFVVYYRKVKKTV